MAHRVVWTTLALAEVYDIFKYIAPDSPGRARNLVGRIYEAVGKLADFPFIGTTVPRSGRNDVRQILVSEYRIVYKVTDEEVQVRAVRHTRRRFPPRGKDRISYD